MTWNGIQADDEEMKYKPTLQGISMPRHGWNTITYNVDSTLDNYCSFLVSFIASSI